MTEERAVLEHLLTLPANEANEELDNLGAAWTFHAFGDTFQVTIQELADATGLPEERIAAFVSFFSVKFGTADEEVV